MVGIWSSFASWLLSREELEIKSTLFTSFHAGLISARYVEVQYTDITETLDCGVIPIIFYSQIFGKGVSYN
jgi:hypothetical protein